LLNNQVGFAKTFFIIAGFIGVAFLLQLFVVPNRVNRTKNQPKFIEHGEPTKQITFMNFFKNRRAMMGCVSTIFGVVFILFYLTIYSDYLINDVGIQSKYIGFFFCIVPGTYFIASPIVGYLSNRIPRIYIITVSFFIITIADLLFGPSYIIGFPQKVPIIIAGTVLVGLSYSLVLVPLIAEIIDAVKQMENIP
jgi:predicted MFS family arabinose efflux permease